MEGSNKRQIIKGWNFDIILESGEPKENREYWQRQCNFLYSNILKDLPTGSIQPLRSKSAQGEKGGFVAIFSVLSATGITSVAFDRIFNVMKIWLENRPQARVSLKYQDGSTIELTGLSKTEALRLIETHQEQSKNIRQM